MAARKIPVEFSEWRPDVATLDTKFANEVENVFAGVNSYLPFPSLLAFTDASLSNPGNDEFTKVLLPFTGADASTVITDTNTGGAAHTWTAAGNAQIDTAQAVAGGTGSLLLDGTGDWVTTPDHVDFTLGTEFTIDCFFYVDVVGVGSGRWLAGQGNTAADNTSTSFALSWDTTGRIRADVCVGSTLYTNVSDTVFTDTLNPGWHHLAFVRNGFTLRLFIDGIRDGSDVSMSGTINNSTNALCLGARGEYISNTWKGWIAQFRISSKARWWENFTPARTPYFNAGGRSCGLYSARTEDGGWKIYAGTITKLLSWSSIGWVDVSRTAGGAYNVPPTEMWSFEQSGNKLAAVNINDDPQWIDVDAGTSFAAIPGSPPRAGHVRQMGDFLFLSRLDNGSTFGTIAPTTVNNRCIVWSGINDPTHWEIGLNLCDMQEFPDGGPVQGVAGAEIGYAIQDRTIRTIQFLPGDTTFIFNFSRVLHDRGSVSKYGFSSIGNVLYFLAEDGFYSLTGQQVTAVGADKVNEWFLAHSDITRRDVVHCIAGVNKPRVAWVFHASSASPMYDKQIIFDWSNGRWAKASVAAQIWGLLTSGGLDLDTPPYPGETEFGDALLDSEALALDSFAYIGGRPLIGAIDANGALATLQGPNLPATLETAEVHLAPGQRAFVNQVYPLDDAASDAPGTISNGTRETLHGGAPFWMPPIEIEPAVGSAFIMTSARLHRFRRFIPNASTWTHAQGLIVDAQPDGEGVNL